MLEFARGPWMVAPFDQLQAPCMQLVIQGPEGEAKIITLEKDSVAWSCRRQRLAYPDDPWLSRYHLRFEPHVNGWQVLDCESRNGTILNTASLRSHTCSRRGPHLCRPPDHRSAHRNFGYSRGIVSFVPGPGNHLNTTRLWSPTSKRCSGKPTLLTTSLTNPPSPPPV